MHSHPERPRGGTRRVVCASKNNANVQISRRTVRLISPESAPLGPCQSQKVRAGPTLGARDSRDGRPVSALSVWASRLSAPRNTNARPMGKVLPRGALASVIGPSWVGIHPTIPMFMSRAPSLSSNPNPFRLCPDGESGPREIP
jgi:hypothetical protein